MIPARSVTPNELSAISVPFLWPMVVAAQTAKRGFDFYASNLAFIAEEQKIHHDLRPPARDHQSRDAGPK